MGQLNKPDSEHELALSCNECGTDYWTDTTQHNACPRCGVQDYNIRD